MCGAFFDAPENRARLKTLEARAADPNFWSNQEAAQGVLRDRKRAEEQIAADEKLTSSASDIETYIDLAKQETNVEQKNDLLKDLDKELTAADTYISELVPKRVRGKAFAFQQAIGFCAVPLVALLAWLLVPADPLGFSGVAAYKEKRYR